ncbi:hypothetical protein HanPI659440_Chr14g0571531 [Helianthus annuus]|nr:hypothetical protein HanPI659440_Chr14g0571531 [Helianthus annuus]
MVSKYFQPTKCFCLDAKEAKPIEEFALNSYHHIDFKVSYVLHKLLPLFMYDDICCHGVKRIIRYSLDSN